MTTTTTDLPAELVISVTAEDIRLGVPGNVCRCAVALAIVRALGCEWAGFLKVEEDKLSTLQASLYIELDVGNPYAVYLLPEDAAAFVRRFDDAAEVAPFTFTASLESETAS